MATLAELTSQVITFTRRIEKEEQIRTYLKKAIIHSHSLKTFNRDLLDTVLPVVGGGASVGTVELPDDFKKVTLARPRAGSSFISGLVLKEIPIEKLVSYEVAGKDINTFYQTGTQLIFKSNHVVDEVGLIYQSAPLFTSLDYSEETWIMKMYPEAIMDLARAMLFGALGDKENSNHLMAQWRLWAKDIVNTEN